MNNFCLVGNATRILNLIFVFVLFSVNNVLGQLSAPINVNIPKNQPIELGFNDVNAAEISFKWLPAKNATQAADIWSNGDRWSFLNMASISGTSNGGTASVDIISDFLGPMRFSLSGNVSASKDSSEKQKVERFLSGGGSAVLTGNILGPTLAWGKSSYILTSFTPKLGFDFPALGVTTSSSTANLDLGLEVKINLPLSNDNLGFFGNARGAYTIGGNDFYKQIDSANSNPFGYCLLNAGITLPQLKMAILFTRVLAGPSYINSYNGNGRISLVISPKK